MHKKLKEWLKRYLPAEIFATIGAVLGAVGFYYFTSSRAIGAIAGTILEVISYFAFILVRDILNSRKDHQLNYKRYGFVGFLKNIRNILVEFGPAEVIDNLVIRPLFFYIFPLLIGNYAIGIIAGKIAADIVYYLPTIALYEFRKKYLK